MSFPLLADFHPKGEVAQRYGLYLAEKGITDRATVIIDADGIVRYVASVTPAGERDIETLLAEAEKINRDFKGKISPAKPTGLPRPEGILYVKSNCGFSRTALLACDNLHLTGKLVVKNISDDADAKSELRNLIQKEQAPCLVVEGKPMLESKDIVNYLVDRFSPL